MTSATSYDLTRSCILGSIPPERWLKLLKLHLTNVQPDALTKELEDMCRALITLLESFPSSEALHQYLELALDNGLLPLSIYVATFPKAILASTQLQTQPSTWSRILALALKYHIASDPGITPKQLLDSDAPTRNLDAVDSVVKLLKASYTIPTQGIVPGTTYNMVSPPEPGSIAEQTTQSLTTLLLLLLSALSTPPLARLSPTASMLLITSVTELVQGYPVSDPRVEGWLMSFTLHTGAMLRAEEDLDMFGVIRDAQPDNEGTAAPEAVQIEEDIVAATAIIRSLLENRATKTHGPSSTSHAVSLLLATYRSTIIPPLPRNTSAGGPSVSPSVSINGQQQRVSASNAAHTPGITPGMTPAGGATAPQNRTPLGAIPLGRTPSATGNHHHTPSLNMMHQVHTPAGMAHTPAGRTPGNAPRTPGAFNRVARTPTTSFKDSKRPGQIRAQIFYEKLLLAVTALVAEDAKTSPGGTAAQARLVCRRAFIFGKLPELLEQFQLVASACSSSSKQNQPSFRNALEAALTTLFNGHGGLLDSCDNDSSTTKEENLAGESQDDSMNDDSRNKVSIFRRNLLSAFIHRGLLSLDFCKGLYPELSAEPSQQDVETKYFKADAMVLDQPFEGHDATSIQSGGTLPEYAKLSLEAAEAGMSLQDYCNSRLQDGAASDIAAMLDLAEPDYSSHASVTLAIQKHFDHLASSLDLDRFSTLTRVLCEHGSFIEIMSLHVSISGLVAEGLAFIEDFEFDAVADPQWTFTNVGLVFLFVQSCAYRFGLHGTVTTSKGRKLSVEFLVASPSCQSQGFTPEERVVANKWHKYVFDPSSEGIGDKLLRSTHPKLLLRMAASIFCEALTSKVDLATLRSGGIAYFLEPLLSWSLVGVIRGLVDEARKRGFASPLYLHVVQSIVLSPDCPPLVVEMSGRAILRLLDDPTMAPVMQGVKINVDEIRKITLSALQISSTPSQQPEGSPPTAADPRGLIAHFLASDFSSAPPPPLSHLLLYRPKVLFECVYGALVPVAKLDDPSRACRRLALSLFAIPRPPYSKYPPLLPFFLSFFLPEVIPIIDRMTSVDQAASVGATASLISWSLLVTLRMERATLDVGKVRRHSGVADGTVDTMDVDIPKERTPYDVASLTRGLSKRLKALEGTSAKLIYDKLVATPYFSSNFPAFASQ